MALYIIGIFVILIVSIGFKVNTMKQNRSHMDQARIHLKKGNIPHAITSLELSIAEDKKQYEAYKLLADTYFQIKSFDLALEMYHVAIANNEEPIAYFNRGITYVSLNQIDLAINDVTKCLNSYKGDKNFIYKELGYLYQMKGDQLQSKSYYDMIMKTSA
jgi:tetratricopeptide (TPR) repeat protein